MQIEHIDGADGQTTHFVVLAVRGFELRWPFHTCPTGGEVDQAIRAEGERLRQAH